jgi:hypothetical protein
VLHFFAGLVGHPGAALVGGFAKAQFTDPLGLGGISNLNSLFFGQFLMDALHPAITIFIKLNEKLYIQLDLIASGSFRHHTLLFNDITNGAPIHT